MKKRLGAFVLATVLAVPVMTFAADPLPAGFIAPSESKMTWNQAKTYCEQQGGRLPLIDGSDNIDTAKKDHSIDGFGAVGGPWPTDLPNGSYWTDTGDTLNPGHSWCAVHTGGDVSIYAFEKEGTHRAFCVPQANK